VGCCCVALSTRLLSCIRVRRVLLMALRVSSVFIYKNVYMYISCTYINAWPC